MPALLRRWRLLAVWGAVLGLAAAAAALDIGRDVRPPDDGHGHSSGVDLSGDVGRPAIPGRFHVFGFGEADLGAVEFVWRGSSAGFVRDGEGRWARSAHAHGEEGHAHEGEGAGHAHGAGPDGGSDESEAISEQLALTSRMLADHSIRPELPLDGYGLEKPQAIVVFYGRDGEGGVDRSRPLEVLHIGDLLTSEYAYYARQQIAQPWDLRRGGGEEEVLLLPRYHVALLLGFAFGEENAPSPLPPLELEEGHPAEG